MNTPDAPRDVAAQARVVADSVDLRNPDWRADLRADVAAALAGVEVLPGGHAPGGGGGDRSATTPGDDRGRELAALSAAMWATRVAATTACDLTVGVDSAYQAGKADAIDEHMPAVLALTGDDIRTLAAPSSPGISETRLGPIDGSGQVPPAQGPAETVVGRASRHGVTVDGTESPRELLCALLVERGMPHPDEVMGALDDLDLAVIDNAAETPDPLASAPGLWWSPTAGLIRGLGNGGHDDAVPLTPAARGEAGVQGEGEVETAAMSVLQELVEGEDNWTPDRDEAYQAAKHRARALVGELAGGGR